MENVVGVRFSDTDIMVFDTLVSQGVYLNKSDAVRDLARRGAREELAKIEMRS